MKPKSPISTKRIVFAALMAALTTAGSYLRITVPADIVGTSAFHLGNIICALSGLLLGPWLGGLAAGLGSALFDILNPLYISECWITFLTKGAYGVVVGLVFCYGRRHYGKALLSTVCGAVTYAILYLSKTFFYNGLLLHALTPEAAGLTVISKLPATAFNAAVAILAAPLLWAAVSKALKKSHLHLE